VCGWNLGVCCGGVCCEGACCEGACCEGVYGVALGLEIPLSFATVDGDALAVLSLIAMAAASTPAAPMLSPAATMRPLVLSFLRWDIATIVPVVLEENLRIV